MQSSNYNMRPLLLALLCCTLLYLLNGCASMQQAGPAHHDKAEANSIWTLYSKATELRSASTPYSISATLRYQNGDSGHRVALRVWGNDFYSIRMDIEAGIGATVAKISQTKNTFMAFSPRENKAVVHQGSEQALMQLGLPIPFSLSDIVALLNGKFDLYFPHDYIGSKRNIDGTYSYTLPAEPEGSVSTLRLDAQGRPVLWTFSTTGRQNVTLAFSNYDDGSNALPNKIEMISGDDRSAKLFVKSRYFPAKAYLSEHMNITLPPGTTISPLQRRKTDY